MGSRGKLGWPTWIGIVVDDLDGQRRFWGDLLRCPETAVGADYVQFDMGEGRTFELVRRSALPQYDRRRFQVGFAVEDIGEAREQLVRTGVDPLTAIEGDESFWAYFRDPEGNVFEITQRPG
ncbi:MAG TPA: VOC family protein [Gaiellaceae bacterium]|jgi:predicted enzyme related to lactoylglutathione lyase